MLIQFIPILFILCQIITKVIPRHFSYRAVLDQTLYSYYLQRLNISTWASTWMNMYRWRGAQCIMALWQSPCCKSDPHLFFSPPDEDGSGGEESGSGCDSPSCDTDRDMYFSTPPNPGNPRVNQVVVGRSPSIRVAPQESIVLALCGLALVLLAPHLR